MFILNNTLTIWSELMPKIHPVLFILYSATNEAENILINALVTRACQLRWTVLHCPHCNNGKPVLGSMFQNVYSLGHSTWYAYSQSQVLFDTSLLTAIDKLQFYIKKIRPYGLLVGSQYSIQVM